MTAIPRISPRGTLGTFTLSAMPGGISPSAMPRAPDPLVYAADPAQYKFSLAGYVSPSDLTQLFVKAVETLSIENEHGVPWQVVYAISNNKRGLWSLTSARQVLDYQPEDDSEVKFADDIRRLGLDDATRIPDVAD